MTPADESRDDRYGRLARLGTATVYEAAGRSGLIDVDLRQVLAGSRAAGPARTVVCGQGDNLMVHAALAQLRPGEVLVLTMPQPEPVALVGELLATQAKVHGAAAMLIDAAVRDTDDLVALGLPIWARYVSIRGATKHAVGTIGEPVSIADATIRTGDLVILDSDGAVVVTENQIDDILAASLRRAEKERVKREKLEQGLLSYDLDGLRKRVEAPSG